MNVLKRFIENVTSNGVITLAGRFPNTKNNQNNTHKVIKIKPYLFEATIKKANISNNGVELTTTKQKVTIDVLIRYLIHVMIKILILIK
ncbi:MAG: hypothetical protein QXK76_02635 [Candidatus Woesearchaeota archaeon]